MGAEKEVEFVENHLRKIRPRGVSYSHNENKEKICTLSITSSIRIQSTTPQKKRQPTMKKNPPSYFQNHD